MTATQREGLSDAALALTQPVIDELLKDIARRIKDAGAITDTAEYQIYRAQALGESKQAIKAAVARQIKAQDKVIDSLFDYILDNSTPLTANGSLKQIAEGYAKMSRQKTAEQLKNLWADTPQGKVLPIQDAYAKALDFAFRQTVTGALVRRPRLASGAQARRMAVSVSSAPARRWPSAACAPLNRKAGAAWALSTPAAAT